MENNYNISLTREVKTEKLLPPLARLIYGDICTLSKNNGKCFATNKFLAKEYGVSVKTISRHITALVKARYIKTEMVQIPSGNFMRYITPLKMEVIKTDSVQVIPKKKDCSYLG